MSSHERIFDYTTFILTVSYQVVTPILPVYLYKALRASEQEVGVIISVAAITSAILRIPSSLWTMRTSAIKLLILGISSNTIALLGYTLSINPWMLAVFRAIHGFSFALNYTLMLSLASLIVQPDRAQKAITRYTSSLAMGLWMGPAVGVILSSLMSLRLLMLSATLISLGAVALAILFLKTRPKLWGDLYYSKTGMAAAIRDLMRRPIAYPTILYLLYSTAIGALLAYGPLKAKLILHMPDPLIILTFTVYYLIVFLLRIALTRAAHIVSDTRLLHIALASCALGILVTGLSQSTPLFMMGVYLTAIAQGLTFPLTALIVAHIIPPNLRTIGNAIYLTSWDIGNLLGPIIVAILLSKTPLSIALAATSIPAMTALPLVRRLAKPIS